MKHLILQSRTASSWSPSHPLLTQAPAAEGPAPVPATGGPAPVPAAEGPAPVPATGGPAPVPAAEGPAPVPAVEGPVPASATEHPAMEQLLGRRSKAEKGAENYDRWKLVVLPLWRGQTRGYDKMLRM